MTSGNVSDEPIAYRDDDALARLARDRRPVPAPRPADRDPDRRLGGARRRAPAAHAVLRRSRGYVPAALPLPGGGTPRPLLACGAELKNTFCLRARASARGSATTSATCENYETLRSFTEGIEHFERLFAVAPEVVAHDLHPEYLSTKYALERDGVELIGVQHHHAHLAACLAEHGEPGPRSARSSTAPATGLDGTVWGGELLVGDLGGVRARSGTCCRCALPGGERGDPRAVADGLLVAGGAVGGDPTLPAPLAGRVDARAWAQVRRLVRSAARPRRSTTSMGRLFDAVAALCGMRAEVNYEGQAAIELEAACDPRRARALPDRVSRRRRSARDRSARDDPRGRRRRRRRRVPRARSPRRFHAAVAGATVRGLLGAGRGARHRGRRAVRRRVPEPAAARGGRGRPAPRSGLRVLMPERLPVNDGGISYGQAAVARGGWRRG